MKLTDYLNAINHTKKDLFDTDDEFVEKEYVPFVVNRCLSYFPDTIYAVNEMNMKPLVDKKMQFHFLSGIIRPRKRFSKWEKKKKYDDIEVVKKFFGYSNRRAEEALSFLSSEQIEEMKEEMDTGGN
tara:strand:- start:2544 stop:2924 length:381 start_codon:yes stop_codon:yes gene_type:complete